MSSVQYAYTQPKHYNKPQRQIVEGNFPVFENYRELAVFKFNRFLCSLLFASIAILMVSYSSVIAKEDQIAVLHNKINDINYENVDLQNKVEYIKSYYNVDNKVTQANFLKKADKVIEVSAAITAAEKDRFNLNSFNAKPVMGF